MGKDYMLGIYAGFHGVSGTLLENGIPVVAIQLERITGIKRCWLVGRKYNCELARQRVEKDYQDTVLNFEDYFGLVIEYMLKSAKIKMSDIEIVALEKRNLFNSPFDSYIMDAENELDKFFNQQQIVYVEHHQGHQAQAFYPSPFSEAAILTIDGRSWDKVERIGSHLSFTASLGQHPRINTIVEKSASLTSLYYELSEILFQERHAEGKMMGLSSLGQVEFTSNPKNRAQYAVYIEHIHNIGQESSPLFAIDSGDALLAIPGLSPIDKSVGPNKIQKIAAYLCQKHYEANLIKIVKDVKKTISSDFLCIAGGGGLNSVGNKKISDLKIFKDIFVFPNCGDEGLSFGFALWAYHQSKGNRKKWKMGNDFWGRSYSNAEMAVALNQYESSVVATSYPDESLFSETASLISHGKVVGWFQGQSEFGPRALGNRSILANPCVQDIQDIVNQKIKFREEWRPFAPSIMVDHAQIFFDTDHMATYQYMLMITDARPPVAGQIPAVTHIDQTARVQIVDQQSNPRFFGLLNAFYLCTGTPVLLNTSFNLAGKPLVETPQQALHCFLNSNLDALIMGNYIIFKKPENGK